MEFTYRRIETCNDLTMENRANVGNFTVDCHTLQRPLAIHNPHRQQGLIRGNQSRKEIRTCAHTRARTHVAVRSSQAAEAHVANGVHFSAATALEARTLCRTCARVRERARARIHPPLPRRRCWLRGKRVEAAVRRRTGRAEATCVRALASAYARARLAATITPPSPPAPPPVCVCLIVHVFVCTC